MQQKPIVCAWLMDFDRKLCFVPLVTTINDVVGVYQAKLLAKDCPQDGARLIFVVAVLYLIKTLLPQLWNEFIYTFYISRIINIKLWCFGDDKEIVKDTIRDVDTDHLRSNMLQMEHTKS